MIRNWYNQIPYPALKTKREITKYINWRKVLAVNRMNSSFPNRWSFSYLKFTKYVTNIIAEPKYKYGQQEQVTVRNHNRSTVSKRQQMQLMVKAYTAISFKTHLGRFSKQKSYPSCILLVFVHKFKISIKWFLSGEFRWSLCQFKHQTMNLLESREHYWRCSPENLCVCVCTTTVFGNEELRTFLETPKLILTFKLILV